MTPDEYLALYSGQLEPYPNLQQALRQTTSLYRETGLQPASTGRAAGADSHSRLAAVIRRMASAVAARRWEPASESAG